MRNTKKMNRIQKLLITAMSLALILGISIGVSFAFVFTDTPDLENSFVPGKVQVSVQLTTDDSTDTFSSAVVVNDMSNIPVYIRVAVVTNWAHSSGGVCGDSHAAQLPEITLDPNGDWVKGSDGYYYYKKPVAVGEATANLLAGTINLPTAADGCTAQVYILATAIQAQGSDGTYLAVQDAWGADVPVEQ